MTQLRDDSRHRPVVFETRAVQSTHRMRRPFRLLAGSTLVFAALAGAVGLALGGSAVWSVLGTNVPNNAPAPLWIAPPTRVAKVPAEDRTAQDRVTHDTITTSHHPATSGHPSSTNGTHAGTPATRGQPEPGDTNRGGGTSTGKSPGGGGSGSGGASGKSSHD